MNNTTGATSGAGVAYPSGAPEFTFGFVRFVLLQLRLHLPIRREIQNIFDFDILGFSK